MSGPLRGLWSWTYDGGAGIDDSLVAISAGGDVVIYQGTDPASASTFALKGVWSVGAVPEGRRFATASGGELLILSALGLVPISVLTRGATTYDPANSLTRAIAPLFGRLFASYGAYRGWSVQTHPTANGLLVVVPVSDAGDSQQLFFSFATKGWYVWRDLPILCAATWSRELYFGTGDGRVCVQRGYVDDVQLDDSSDFDPVEYSGLTAFWNGGNARNKQVQLIRPVLDSDVGLPVCQTTAKYDYDTVEPTAPTDTTELTLPEGHDSSEDGDANALAVYRFNVISGGVTASIPSDYGLTVVDGSGAASIGIGQIGGALALANTGVSSAGARAYSGDGATVAAFRTLFAASTWAFEGWLYHSDFTGGFQSWRATVFDLGVVATYATPSCRLNIVDDSAGSYQFEIASAGSSFFLGTLANEAVAYSLTKASFNGAWKHLGVRKSASRTDLFIDGVKVATRGQTNSDVATVDRLSIGASSDAAAQHTLNATLDDFAFYSDARTDAEILADYQRGAPTPRAGASGFDEAVWDTAVWDGQRIHQPLSGATGMGRAFAVAFQGNAIGRTAIIGFDVQYTEGGSL
jgi:hypothetical protein